MLTAAIKMRVVEAHLPLFLEGMASGTTSCQLLVLQHFHLALATKQPSVTAATFAGIVRVTRGRTRLEKLAEFISRITRSQLASAAGNLLAVARDACCLPACGSGLFRGRSWKLQARNTFTTP